MKSRDPKDRSWVKYGIKKQSSDCGRGGRAAEPPESFVFLQYKNSLSIDCKCGAVKVVTDSACEDYCTACRHVNKSKICFSCGGFVITNELWCGHCCKDLWPDLYLIRYHL